MSHLKAGEKIKALRIQSGISQEELSQSTQLSLRTIQRIENGETEPRGDSLKRIANALHVKVEELTGRNASKRIMLTLKEDESILILLQISAFGFLIYPFFGVLFPMFLWLYFKDKIAFADQTGKRVMRFQAIWCTTVAFFYTYFIVAKLNHIESSAISNQTVIVCIVILYVLNAIVILLHLFKLTTKKKLLGAFHNIYKF